MLRLMRQYSKFWGFCQWESPNQRFTLMSLFAKEGWLQISQIALCAIVPLC